MQVFDRFTEALARSGADLELEQRAVSAGGDPDIETGTRQIAVPAGWSDSAAQALADLLTTPRPIATLPRKGGKTIGALAPHVADGDERQGTTVQARRHQC